MAVLVVCDRVGFSMNYMLATIHHYALRNGVVHAVLMDLVRDDRLHTLTKRLYDGFWDILCLVPTIQDVPSGLMPREKGYIPYFI